MLDTLDKRFRKLFLWLLAMAVIAVIVWFAFPSRIEREKLATVLVMPAGVVWMLLGLVCVIACQLRQKLIAACAITAWLVLTLAGNMFVGRYALISLEREFLNCRPLEEGPFDTIVVLGGGVTPNMHGEGQTDVAGDRVTLAAQMYHANRTARFVCTGSYIQGIDVGGGRTQGTLAAQILARLGVPPERIETVDGRTTIEEMAELQKLLANDTNIGLVTSASHMRRALRLARNAGIEFTPLPADFAARPALRLVPLDMVPSGMALDMSARATKEYLARLVGR